MNIIHVMSSYYGVQSQLCDLNAVKPLIGILLFENNPELKRIAVDTLHNISKLKKGRKLIRLTGGIRLLVYAPLIIFKCPGIDDDDLLRYKHWTNRKV